MKAMKSNRRYRPLLPLALGIGFILDRTQPIDTVSGFGKIDGTGRQWFRQNETEQLKGYQLAFADRDNPMKPSCRATSQTYSYKF